MALKLAWERWAYAINGSPRIVPVTRCHALPGAGREMIEAHDTASAIAGALWVVEMLKEVDIVMLGYLSGYKVWGVASSLSMNLGHHRQLRVSLCNLRNLIGYCSAQRLWRLDLYMTSMAKNVHQ